MKQLTHGSLFAGIGGFDLGFERAGIKTVWQVEIDPFCRKVLERHFPDARRYHNIKRVKRFAEVDVISGGFPCQDISQAGKRVGIGGKRSGLWSEMWRVIRELRPQLVVVENVAALLHRGIERVVGDLAAIGYDAEWDCLPAVAFGAPHRRDRVWIIAYPAGDLRGASGDDRSATPDRRNSHLAHSNGNGRDGRPASTGRQARPIATGSCENGRSNVADTENSNGRRSDGSHNEGRRNQETGGCRLIGDWAQHWRVEPDVGRVAHGIPARVDRLKGLGNAVVPQIAEWIGKRIIDAAEEE